MRLIAPVISSATSPPSLMSTPRPAMLVAMVTPPKEPAPAIIWLSSVCLRAFSTWCGMPACKTDPRRIPSEAVKPRMLINRPRFSDAWGLKDISKSRAIFRICEIGRLSRGWLRNSSSGTARPSSSRLFASIHASRSMVTVARRRIGSVRSRFEMRSESSTEVVPTRIGLPWVCMRMISMVRARSLASSVR